MSTFTHLHVHSHFSLLDGLAKIDELTSRAKELGMDAVALTDHGNMYGAIQFYTAAKEAGIKPILGNEMYMAQYGMHMKRPGIDKRPYHIVLLARDLEGYHNLIKLTTKSYLQGFYYKPRIDFNLLKQHSRGLIALSGCMNGEISRLILDNKMKDAATRAREYQALFGQDNYYLELQHNPGLPNQQRINEALVEIARGNNIPLVASNDVHYLRPDDAQAQDILLCIQMNKTVQDKNRLSMIGEDFSMKSPSEMEKIFSDYPEAIENTSKIAERCNVELPLGLTRLPHYNVPPGSSPETHLEKLCHEGLRHRYGKDRTSVGKDVLERLQFELSVIKKTGFAAYFLIVQDFVNWAKKKGIVVGPGRGSAAGSLVSYLLNVTDIEPLKYGLLFERFLNPDRINMPDIDLDFADHRRDEVIDYVRKKYGPDHVAQIITFGTMAARAAIRDAGRALAIPYSFCDQVAKLIPIFTGLTEAKKKVKELGELYEADPQAKKLIDTAQKIEGCSRHASTHACGVVITKEPLDEHAPRQFARKSSGSAEKPEKAVVTQYEMHAIEDLGLLKMDFLGLRNLTILERALNIIEETQGVKIDLAKIPLDHQPAYGLLQSGQTTGIFQLESSGMRRYLKQLKPTEFEDIIVMVSLYRPGPMELIPKYIARKHGQEKVTYLHPSLEPILEKTYGIGIYQEQMMRIASDLAGYSLSEADTLRKAIGKKIKKLLDQQEEKLVKGLMANNIDEKTAQEIWELFPPFARYGFNRSHAACYAMIAYRTAYLKALYPEEFMTALLITDQENLDRVSIEVAECSSMGIEVLPPSINESVDNFSISPSQDKKKAIRFGLCAIKNVGRETIRQVVAERKQNGRFATIDDLLSRTAGAMNRRSLESLIKAGALDELEDRNRLLSNIEQLLRFARSQLKQANSGQTDLFGSKSGVHYRPSLKLGPAEQASKEQRLAWEKELLGLYISEHPLAEHEEYLRTHASMVADIKKTAPVGKQVTVGGIINKIQRVVTKNSKTMVFAQIEDTTSSIEILVFPRQLEAQPELWQEDNIILVSGKISDKDGVPKLLADRAKKLDLDNMTASASSLPTPGIKMNDATKLFLRLPGSTSTNLLEKLKVVFDKHGGNHRVILILPGAESKHDIVATEFRVAINPVLLSRLRELLGERSVKVK